MAHKVSSNTESEAPAVAVGSTGRLYEKVGLERGTGE